MIKYLLPSFSRDLNMPLPTNRALIIRLLHLFPIKFLKEHFNETGGRDEVIEIISNAPSNSIASFVQSYHDVTKQNLYLYTLNRPFNPATDLANFPFEIISRTQQGNLTKLVCYPNVTYSVYLSNPVARENLDFLQPVAIEIDGQGLIIKCTKLEKNVKSYFAPDREPKLAGETNTEEQIIDQIVNHFKAVVGAEINDFNEGIKALWAADDVDCHRIRYRDAHSTVLITMDEQLTFKQQYPDKYVEMSNSPIGPSVWKFLTEGENLPETFNCDPSSGTISVNKYTADTNQTGNVIRKILG